MKEVATASITRKELYERVWAESVAHVAPQLGLWQRRVSDLCRKNRIPVPGRGYWYYSSADRKTMRDPLPDADQDWEIVFTPSQPGPPKPAADESTVPRIFVPDVLRRFHRLVQEAKVALSDTWLEHGILRPPRGCMDIRVSQASLRRACRIMDTLIKVCEQRGWTVRVLATQWFSTVINVNGCDVGAQLVEGWRQEPRELSESDKEWEAQRARPRKRPPYELVPNGRFTLRLDSSEAWLHAHWRDGKRRRLEDMLDGVMARLEGVPESKRRADKARAAAEERRREEERLRQEEEDRQRELERVRRAEQARVDALLADAEAWAISRTLRDYIAAKIAKFKATGTDMSEGSKAGVWVKWAMAQADRIDPLAP